MAFLKTKYLGNGRFESECMKCGEVMLWGEGDDVFVQVFENGDKGMYCSKCYEGPRMSREEVEKVRKQ